MNRYLIIPFILILSMGLIFGGCPTPAPEPSPAPAPTPVPASPPTSEPSPASPPSEPSAPVTKIPEPPVEYTLKYFSRSESKDEADKFWTFGPNSLLIHFDSPVDPFTIKKIKFLGWIFGNDTRKWDEREFKLKIWEKFPDKELWVETYPYTDFNPTKAKWQEYEIPDVKVGKTFSLEFIPDAETTIVGVGNDKKRVFKCGVAMGVDYGAKEAKSDTVFQGAIMPWTEFMFDGIPREKVGWMVKIQGEGAPRY